MFRGIHTVTVDSKGRFAVPSKVRDLLLKEQVVELVITLNPWDRALWLYPLLEWERIENLLSTLSDFDRQTRRTKQIMRGYASDCSLDPQGRILLSQEMRSLTAIEKDTVLLGQGNKLEIWEASAWKEERDSWLESVGEQAASTSSGLDSLSL
tara:strand:- start:87 stop:545 length:459 start_codon:yes stop_codon:yes gene_type:complete